MLARRSLVAALIVRGDCVAVYACGRPSSWGVSGRGASSASRRGNDAMQAKWPVTAVGRQRSHCGYCGSSHGSVSEGLVVTKLSCAVYNDLIDRGWRRSGTYLYRPDLRETCCQLLTLRLDADAFRPTKGQRQTLARWERMLQRRRGGEEGEPSGEAGPQGGRRERARSQRGGGGKGGKGRGGGEGRAGGGDARAPGASSLGSGALSRSPRPVTPGGSLPLASEDSLETTLRGALASALRRAVAAGELPAASDRCPARIPLAPPRPGSGGRKKKGAKKKQTAPCPSSEGEHGTGAVVTEEKAGQSPGGAGGEGAAHAAGGDRGLGRVEGGAAGPSSSALPCVSRSPFASSSPDLVSPIPQIVAGLARAHAPRTPRERSPASAAAAADAATSPLSPSRVAAVLSAHLELPAGVLVTERDGYLEFRRTDGGKTIAPAETAAQAERASPPPLNAPLAPPPGPPPLPPAQPRGGSPKRPASPSMDADSTLSPKRASFGRQPCAEETFENVRAGGVREVSRAPGGPERTRSADMARAPEHESAWGAGAGVSPPTEPSPSRARSPSAPYFEVVTLPSDDPSILATEYSLFRAYQIRHHGEAPQTVTVRGFKRFLCDSPLVDDSAAARPGLRADSRSPFCRFGSFHQQYWLGGRLVAVGVVDALPRGLSSVYAFWDPDCAALGLGKVTCLLEILGLRAERDAANGAREARGTDQGARGSRAAEDACRKERLARGQTTFGERANACRGKGLAGTLGAQARPGTDAASSGFEGSIFERRTYYLGYYLHSCHRMRYKADYGPCDVLCPVTLAWVRLSPQVAARLQARPWRGKPSDLLGSGVFADDPAALSALLDVVPPGKGGLAAGGSGSVEGGSSGSMAQGDSSSTLEMESSVDGASPGSSEALQDAPPSPQSSSKEDLEGDSPRSAYVDASSRGPSELAQIDEEPGATGSPGDRRTRAEICEDEGGTSDASTPQSPTPEPPPPPPHVPPPHVVAPPPVVASPPVVAPHPQPSAASAPPVASAPPAPFPPEMGDPAFVHLARLPGAIFTGLPRLWGEDAAREVEEARGGGCGERGERPVGESFSSPPPNGEPMEMAPSAPVREGLPAPLPTPFASLPTSSGAWVPPPYPRAPAGEVIGLFVDLSRCGGGAGTPPLPLVRLLAAFPSSRKLLLGLARRFVEHVGPSARDLVLVI